MPAAGGLPDLDGEDDGVVALRTAVTAPDLWRRLLLFGGHGSSADTRDAVGAMCRLHGEGEPGAATTALVLLTSWRFRRSSDGLLRRILEAGVLDDDDLDELAEVGLFEDQASFVLPAAVFSGPTIVLPHRDESASNPVEPETRDLRDVLAVRTTRPMRPPLRRWAAAHVLQRYPHRLDEIRQRTERLAARDAAAAMTGVLDGIAVLTSSQSAEVVRAALDWPHRSVRLRALRLLAAGGHHDEAVARAQDDPDASIRAAAKELLPPASPAGPATLF